jgi:hypothetical protein
VHAAAAYLALVLAEAVVEEAGLARLVERVGVQLLRGAGTGVSVSVAEEEDAARVGMPGGAGVVVEARRELRGAAWARRVGGVPQGGCLLRLGACSSCSSSVPATA